MKAISKNDMEQIVYLALKEDLDQMGDRTTQFTIDPNQQGKGFFVFRDEGIVAGLPIVTHVFKKIDQELTCEFDVKDGDPVSQGQRIGLVKGKISSILTGERTALNFLQRLSGIASLTRQYVDAVRHTQCQILDTRKTTPGLRFLEKYAVRVGGGINHRMGLYDMILIKDNHIDAHGSISKTVKKCIENIKREQMSILIEVETRNLAEVQEAVNLPIQRIMLDNMNFEQMRKAVEIVNGRMEVEASGLINLDKVRETAETGVDLISVGALTHSYKAIDIALILEND